MHQLRIVVAGAVAAAALAFFALPHSRAAAQPSSCGASIYSKGGVIYRILFARNGAVQQYILMQSAHNVEQDHDALKMLETKYGPAGINAPPLKILSFRPGSGGMMIPDKAVDSCGRVSYFDR
jgi:hypothetical protein